MSCLHAWLFHLSFFSAFLVNINSNDDFQISRKSQLFKRENPYIKIPGYFVEIDLGQLEPGEGGLVKIEIENPFDEAIEFGGMEMGCSCLSIVDKLTTHVIPAKDTLELKFRLKVPERSERSEMHFAINFRSLANGDLESAPANLYVITASFKYRLKGFIALTGKLATVEIPESVSFGELRNGFIFSDPISPDDLELFVSDSLRDVSFNIEVHEPGKGVIVGLIPSSLVMDAPIGGEVGIKDRQTGRGASMWLAARKVGPLKLSPLMITFREREDVGLFEAVALIRLTVRSEDRLSVQGTENFDKEAKVQVTFKGKPLVSSTRGLGSQTIRVNLGIPDEMIKSENFEDGIVKFQIYYRQEVFVFEREIQIVSND